MAPTDPSPALRASSPTSGRGKTIAYLPDFGFFTCSSILKTPFGAPTNMRLKVLPRQRRSMVLRRVRVRSAMLVPFSKKIKELSVVLRLRCQCVAAVLFPVCTFTPLPQGARGGEKGVASSPLPLSRPFGAPSPTSGQGEGQSDGFRYALPILRFFRAPSPASGRGESLSSGAFRRFSPSLSGQVHGATAFHRSPLTSLPPRFFTAK